MLTTPRPLVAALLILLACGDRVAPERVQPPRPAQESAPTPAPGSAPRSAPAEGRIEGPAGQPAADELPPTADACNLLGSARFRGGDIAGSLRAFDEAIRLEPRLAPHHWQRGISLYYAGRYPAAQRQFADHRAVNPHDVENAAWHFVCTARAAGLTEARRQLMPIDTAEDTRVPMRHIYGLLAGRESADDVLAGAGADRRGEARARRAHNYAHLYLGLWYEAHGDVAAARRHMRLAARRYRIDTYMGDVAVVHVRLRGWDE